MKRLTSILLALLLAMPAVLTACAESEENPESTAKTQDITTADSSAETETPETERIYADVPADADFEGYEFNINCSSNSEFSVIRNDFYAEDITGEAINDARYMRNIAVGEKLNVTIVSHDASSVGSDAGYTDISKDVQSGTGAFDIATACGYATTRLSTGNYLYNIKEVPYINLEAPWWDQVANKSLSILDQLFYTTGDITTSDDDATYCIVFNKQMIDNFGLENPYELVDDGKWTMDKYIEMSNVVASDTNGDGKYTTADTYGALTWDDTMMGIVNCTGGQCVTVNEEGLMELTINNEKIIDAVTKFLEFSSTNSTFEYQRSTIDDTTCINMFSANQSLFLSQLIQLVPKLREMDNDFGILPYFKYEESQSKYYTTMGSWHSVFLCIPNSQEDINRTGIITECLANEGMYDLKAAYYEKTLKGKSARDAESQAMLDLIFANRVYDLGWFNQTGGYNEAVMNLLRNYNNNIASMLKTTERATQKLLSKTNEAYIEAKAKLEAQQ